MKRLVCLLCALTLAGCDRMCEPETTDEELLAQYAHESLANVYKKHLGLSDCFPHRTTLSRRLADFGPVAKQYALARVEASDLSSYVAAESTISSVNIRHGLQCTPSEYETLLNAARGLPLSDAAKRSHIDALRDVCGFEQSANRAVIR